MSAIYALNFGFPVSHWWTIRELNNTQTNERTSKRLNYHIFSSKYAKKISKISHYRLQHHGISSYIKCSKLSLWLMYVSEFHSLWWIVVFLFKSRTPLKLCLPSHVYNINNKEIKCQDSDKSLIFFLRTQRNSFISNKCLLFIVGMICSVRAATIQEKGGEIR